MLLLLCFFVHLSDENWGKTPENVCTNKSYNITAFLQEEKKTSQTTVEKIVCKDGKNTQRKFKEQVRGRARERERKTSKHQFVETARMLSGGDHPRKPVPSRLPAKQKRRRIIWKGFSQDHWQWVVGEEYPWWECFFFLFVFQAEMWIKVVFPRLV